MNAHDPNKPRARILQADDPINLQILGGLPQSDYEVLSALSGTRAEGNVWLPVKPPPDEAAVAVATPPA